MFKRKGVGVKGLLNNVKKNALFLHDGFPKYLRYVKNPSVYISSNLYRGFFASFFLSTLRCQEYIKAPPRVVITGELNPGIQDFAREIILIKDIFKCIFIADAL